MNKLKNELDVFHTRPVEIVFIYIRSHSCINLHTILIWIKYVYDHCKNSLFLYTGCSVSTGRNDNVAILDEKMNRTYKIKFVLTSFRFPEKLFQIFIGYTCTLLCRFNRYCCNLQLVLLEFCKTRCYTTQSVYKNC